MSWVIAVVCFILLLILRKRSKPKWLWMVNASLAAIGGGAFFSTGMGHWIAGLFAGFLGWLGALFGSSGPLIAGGLVLIAVVIAVLDIAADRRADRAAITSLIVLPMLILIAAGPVANGVGTMYDLFNRAGQSSVGRLIGG